MVCDQNMLDKIVHAQLQTIILINDSPPGNVGTSLITYLLYTYMKPYVVNVKSLTNA